MLLCKMLTRPNATLFTQNRLFKLLNKTNKNNYVEVTYFDPLGRTT